MRTRLRQLQLAAHIALRIVRSRRSKRLSSVTVISIVGVAFGVMALTAVLGVTGGFQQAFQERILGLYPHLIVLKRASDFREYEGLVQAMRELPGVVGVSPATYDDMMIAAGAQRAGAIIKGVELSSVSKVVPVAKLMLDGATLDGMDEEPDVALVGGAVEVRSLVAGTWTTLAVLPDGELAILGEDATPPDAGRARVRLLDLRGEASGTVLSLLPVAAAEPDGELDLRGPAILGASRPGRLSEAIEVDRGAWRIDLTGELVELDEATLVTLVLLARHGEEADGAVPRGGFATRLLIEPARVQVAERRAMVRLVHAAPDRPTTTDAAGASLALRTPSGDLGLPPVRAGEATGFVAVPARLPGIVLGEELARRLHAKVGSEVTLVTPLRGVDNKMLGPYGMAPSSARHVVTGLFRSGFYEYDVRLALVSLLAAQRFLNRGRVIRWIEVAAADLLRVADVKRRVAATVDPYDFDTLVGQADDLGRRMQRLARGEVSDVELRDPTSFIDDIDNNLRTLSLLKYQEVDFGYRPRYRLIDWREMNTNLLSALKLQKVVLTIFFLIIIVVGSFVVVGSQVMVIHEKTSEIAILKAMGATGRLVRLTFTLQGLLVAGVGTVVGLVAGLGLCALAAAIDYRLDATVYLIDRLPVRIVPLDLVIVAGATAICTLLATQYSASRAAAKTPVEGLRAVD